MYISTQTMALCKSFWLPLVSSFCVPDLLLLPRTEKRVIHTKRTRSVSRPKKALRVWCTFGGFRVPCIYSHAS